MINQISEARIKKFLLTGMPEDQIRQDFILKKFLSPEEFTLIINSTKENLINNSESNIIIQSQPEEKQTESIQQIIKPRLNKILCLKLSLELLNKIKQYSKKHGQIQSDYIRDILTTNIK